MEQVLERVYPATDENGEYYLYDDEGNGVTNQRTLRSIAEGQKFIALWRKMMLEED
ncbi:MAG: hypothetical protein II954_01380 [Synergistaceae bacterium]|nr:hypothetical protein [Synergistaceae bacterium]